MPNEGFRTAVVAAGEKAVDIVQKYLNGAPVAVNKLNTAIKTLNQAIKVEHMDQIRDQQSVSNGFRLAQLLRDDKARQEYVDAMRPAIEPPPARKSLPPVAAAQT